MTHSLFHLNTFQLRSNPQFLQKSHPTHQPSPQMALRVHLLYPQILPQPIKIYFPCTTHLSTTLKPQISCTKSSGDSDLASDLALEMEKMSTHLVQREEAMRKSRQLLFTELSEYLGLKSEELEKKWKKMEEDDKWVLVRGFVSEWSVNFHPLSAISVKEMVEEHLVEDNNPPPRSSSESILFPGLKSKK